MRGLLTIGLVQLRFEKGEIQDNLREAEKHILKCIDNGAELICLPELFNTGYYLHSEIQEEIKSSFDETTNLLLNLAHESGVAIVAGIGEVYNNEYYDSAFIAKSNGKSAFFRKTHLFRDEKKYFRQGNELLVTDIKGLKVGILICFEVGFPELSRSLALEGAKLLLFPMAFGSARWRIFETATVARAIENNCFLIASNQVGESKMAKDEYNFYGHSRVVNPLGKIILDMEQKQGSEVVNLDLQLIDKCREGELDEAHSYFEERRPELYKNVVS